MKGVARAAPPSAAPIFRNERRLPFDPFMRYLPEIIAQMAGVYRGPTTRGRSLGDYHANGMPRQAKRCGACTRDLWDRHLRKTHALRCKTASFLLKVFTRVWMPNKKPVTGESRVICFIVGGWFRRSPMIVTESSH
jgi:hypothetical protein